MSIHEKEVPIAIRAVLEFCKPSISTILKYCKNSTQNENNKTDMAAVKTGSLKNDFIKQYNRITTKTSPI